MPEFAKPPSLSVCSWQENTKTRACESGSDRLNRFAISSYTDVGILKLEMYCEHMAPVNTLLNLQSAILNT